MSAVHLEMRDGYMQDDPDLRAWRTGFRHDPADRASWWNPWFELTSQVIQRGVVMRRVRIVSEPVSEYIRYEYDVTFGNAAVGEDVRWLPRRLATGIALPGNDFWLFDGEVLLINHFDGNGDWIDTERVEDRDVLRLCSSAFETTWPLATRHNEYSPA